MERSGNQNEPIVDEEKEDEEFASGKPNEHVQEEEEVESVQPIMTYSILDQSILNWPSIQDWAQKQWVKRHQGYQETSNSPEIPHMPNQIVQRRSMFILKPFIFFSSTGPDRYHLRSEGLMLDPMRKCVKPQN